MSNLTDFFPSGGGGLTPKFQEFNASGTFTPSQALIDAGGYIELFLVGGGESGGSAANEAGGAGGEVWLKKMYITNTNPISVTIGAGGAFNNQDGSPSSFLGSAAGGIDVTALGGSGNYRPSSRQGAGFASTGSSGIGFSAAGSGVLGYGAGGAANSVYSSGLGTPRSNSGGGSRAGFQAGSGYCLIKWYE